VLEEKQRAVVYARQSGAKAPVVAERIVLFLDKSGLLLPLNSERWVGQHVIEGGLFPVLVFGKAIFGKRIAKDDVVGVFALDQHVGLADGPRFVVPVLAE
jgi:hypothetical protein